MLRFGLRWWAPFVVPCGAILAALSLGTVSGGTWGNPTEAFVIVLALTSACVLGAAAIVVFGLVRRLPEVALLGAVAWCASLLATVHGLLLPGGPYRPNPGSMVAIMLAVPLALLAAMPMLVDGTRAGRWLALRWRAWAAIWTAVPIAISVALLLAPHSLPAPPMGGVITIVTMAVSLAGTGALSLRHLRLFAIGRRAGSLLVSLGFITPGLATIAFLGAVPLSSGWWLAHLTDAFGVLFVTVGLLWAHWRDRSVSIVLAPVLEREPLAALELGLTPVIHRFIAALEAKDDVTRQHVIRVSELAMRAGQRAGLNAVSLRAVGLGGLLHDIGKLLTPNAILTKPGALTDAERAVIERHPLDGEALIAPYPHLAEVASVVRWHHERPDGQGYPDRLLAGEIPIAAALVSVVDAWDAMVSDRPYRTGMPPADAEAIIRRGAGSQWQLNAVEAVLSEIHERGPEDAPRFRELRSDRGANAHRRGDDIIAGCLPAALIRDPGDLEVAR